jgi:hypothetical protein
MKEKDGIPGIDHCLYAYNQLIVFNKTDLEGK